MLTPPRLECRSSVSPSVFHTTFWVLLIAFMAFGALSAQAATCTKTATTGVLPPGDEANPCDLEVTTGMVIVDSTSMPAAWANVNIYNGGTLCFVDEGKNLDFWASGILVENKGTLTNGVVNGNVKCATGAFGSKHGTLTIHLWGADQGPSNGKGILCKADSKNQCGISDDVWASNKMDMDHMNPSSCTPTKNLPGGITDCFYQYAPLDFDDGLTDGKVGYVGYKVLAVTYGGSLNLYGQKGVSPMPSPQKEDCAPGKPCPWTASSGRSWGRLAKTVQPKATQLLLDRQVLWQPGDQIVVTATDYIPGHAEQLQVKNVTANDDGTTTLDIDTAVTPVVYDHNGQTFDLSKVPAGVGPDADPNVKCSAGQTRCIDTRAAIGLLSRNIRIVSGCDNYPQNFPAPGKKCDGTAGTDSYYFGGHLVVRQGVAQFLMSGVELYQMGEGGRIMHYPIHFHMARAVPLNTTVSDSSIWDSMNRWVTIHATQGVTLARNVGFLSIGHGFYLEDGTEYGNDLIANLGVMARGAMDNPQNPRKVPGILAGSRKGDPQNYLDTDEVPFHTDVEHPTVFWITNGANSFSYNMAAGANSCGVCYWLLPAANSGMSRYEHWEHYAAEQEYRTRKDDKGTWDDLNYAGTTPLGTYFVRNNVATFKPTFKGNSCVAAQSSFLTVGDTAACKAISNNLAGTPAIENPLAPKYPHEDQPIDGFEAADAYYPKVAAGGARQATVCPFDDSGSKCSTGKSFINPCAYNAQTHKAEDNCAVTVLDRYTSSFTWADTNVSALWLRKQWYLVTNSAITDTQNGGLTFVSGGGYTFSDEIPGYWALANKTVFVGNTQELKDATFENYQIPTPKNPFASNAGPFNPFTKDVMPCVHPQNSMCVSAQQGIFFPASGFAMNQRLFNIYDGPSYQSSSAYLDITKTTLFGCFPGEGGDVCAGDHHWGNGLPLGVPIDSKGDGGSRNQCYLPNAAIAWKQPNGFYYPPAFRSNNLFFNFDSNSYHRVDIRHFVIEPLFVDGTLDTDEKLVEARYCTYSRPITNYLDQTLGTMFQSYTDIDRQTELTDEDGSLTGLQGPTITQFRMPTVSVNKDPFFSVPIETTECSSDIFGNMPKEPLNGGCTFPDDQLCGTANTSPYDYLTTVVFPQTIDDDWAKVCETQACPGVPLYRQDLVMKNGVPETKPSLIRMAGQGTGQRSNLTVNHGRYFLDTTVSEATQDPFACRYWQSKTDTCTDKTSKNVFQPGQEYYVFFLYGRPDLGSSAPPPTKQDYKVYVGTGFDVTKMESLFGIRVDQGQDPPKVISREKIPWDVDPVDADGIITIHVDMSSAKLANFASEYRSTKQNHCAPATYCSWKSDHCGCAHDGDAECENACSWAGKDINCPESDGSSTGGCYGFGFKLAGTFVADDSGASKAASGAKCLLNDNTDWNTRFNQNFSNPNPNECNYSSANIPNSFCTSARPKVGARIGGLSQ